MSDEQLRKDVVMLVRQVEMIRAQVETLFVQSLEVARKVGIEINPPDVPQMPPKPITPPIPTVPEKGKS